MAEWTTRSALRTDFPCDSAGRADLVKTVRAPARQVRLARHYQPDRCSWPGTGLGASFVTGCRRPAAAKRRHVDFLVAGSNAGASYSKTGLEQVRATSARL